MPNLPPSPEPAVLIVDNGSLEPAATLALRDVAQRLSKAVRKAIRPVSLLHSSAIEPSLLGGTPAEILEPTLRQLAGTGKMEVVIVPFFIGPSGALVDYLPERVRHLRTHWPELRVRLAPCLVDAAMPRDNRLAAILAERVRAIAAENKFKQPSVAVVDHGTPQREVNVVREWVAGQVRDLLGDFAKRVTACSMERRPGPEFAFNEPLLETLFDTQEFSSGEAIVAKLFLSPGRHGGQNGDVEKISFAARTRHPGLTLAFTEPLCTHPALIPVLQERLEQGLAAKPLG